MKFPVGAVLAALALIGPPALAQIHDHRDTGFGMDHAMLTSSDPADGAELAAAPQALDLVFRRPVRLGALAMQNGDGATVALVWSTERRALAHSIPLPALAPDAYWVTFTGVSETGQTMPGALHFIVR